MKTLHLTYPHLSAQHPGNDYLVVQVDQDTSFKPGQMLTEREVADLCERPKAWKIITKLNKSK